MPEEIRGVLHINKGDEVEFTSGRDEKSTVHGGVPVPADQAWFFTRERLAGKREADEEIAMSRGTVHGSGEAMFVYLENLSPADG